MIALFTNTNKKFLERILGNATILGVEQFESSSYVHSVASYRYDNRT